MVFWLSFLGIIFELPTAFAQFILDADFTVNIDAVGYYTGYIIGMFIDVILSAVFTGGAKTVANDFKNKPRNYDSEIKYIFNFLKTHINKGDEFIIETQNIFKTCGSCRREFIMLEDYLKTQDKKVKFVVFSDESIKGTARLKEKLKIK